MEQLEKVRKGLQTAVDSDWMWRKADYIAMCCKDALALINAQQERIKALDAAQTVEMPVGEKMKAGDVVLDFYECWHCKNAIRKPWNYCPFCGKAVKWDEAD